MIGIIDYGFGNLRSVQKAFEFIGQRAVVSGDIKILDSCERLVLPGVGSFGAGINELKRRRLFDYIVNKKNGGTKLLGICLGMQFLLSQSCEDGLNQGLDFIKGSVVKFEQGKVPEIGWNGVTGLKSHLFDGIAEGSKFYFVHSYYAKADKKFVIAGSDYHIKYAAAVADGNVYGVQFHPEKSGTTGLKLLKNFAVI